LPDGRDEREIAMPGDEGGGRWSRSGDFIAVTTVLTDGRIGTAIIDPDGTVDRVFEIPDDSLNLACTVWSPDDHRLACEGWDDQDPSRNGIYTVRASDGGELARLTETPAGLADFVGDYSPDGAMFVFKRTTDEDPAPLMLVPVAGGDPTRLSDLPVEDPGRYSPDGKTVLTSSGGRIVMLDTTGHEVGEIVQPGTFLFGPAWAPEGDHVAYSGTESGVFHADIYTSRLDGTDRRQVTSTPDNEIRIEWGAG
jgi:Tol biopolymer transport system component